MVCWIFTRSQWLTRHVQLTVKLGQADPRLFGAEGVQPDRLLQVTVSCRLFSDAQKDFTSVTEDLRITDSRRQRGFNLLARYAVLPIDVQRPGVGIKQR